MTKLRQFYLSMAMLVIAAWIIPVAIIYASDVSNARYRMIIAVSNNGSAATGVSANVSISTPNLISGGYANASVNNTALRNAGGSDVLFMPGYNTNPWMFYIDGIGANSYESYYLYTDNSTGGTTRYFPGAGGMTTSDNTTLEPSSNFTYEIAGMVNMSVSDNIVSKAGALTVTTNAAASNITATMTASSNTTVPSTLLSTGGLANWNAAQLVDGNTGTKGFNVLNSSFTQWHLVDFGAGNTANLIGWSYFIANTGTGLNFAIQYSSDNSSWSNAYTGWTSFPNGWIGVEWTSKGAYRYWRAYGGSNNNQPDFMEFQVKYAYSATVTGQTSEEKTIRASIPNWQTGYVLDFDRCPLAGPHTTDVNLGTNYNSAAKFWVDVWFKPFSLSGVGVADWLYAKASAIDNYFMLRIAPTGVTQVGKNLGAGGQFAATPNTVNLNQWNHVLASISAVNGMRIILNGGAAGTNADTTAMPNAGTEYLGYDGAASAEEFGFDGLIGKVTIGTDDLTTAEEIKLNDGLAPADATDYYFLDEGAGNTIYSYGSGAHNGTRTGATWTLSTYTSGQTGRPYEFGIQVNTSMAKVRYIHGASVADTSNDWITGANYVMPYIQYQKIWVNGVLQQYVYWEYATTFSDHSGATPAHPATPTFRTTTSDPDVLATPFSFLPISESQVSSSVISGNATPWYTVPPVSGNFTTNITSTMPGAAVIKALADASGTPSQLPLTIISGFIVIVCSLSVSSLMREHSSGSVFVKALIIGCLMAIGIAVKAIDFWMLVYFAIFATAFAMGSQHKGGWE